MSLFDSIGGLIGSASSGLSSVFDTLGPLVEQGSDFYGNLQSFSSPGGSPFGGFALQDLLPPPINPPVPTAPAPSPPDWVQGPNWQGTPSYSEVVAPDVSGALVLVGVAAVFLYVWKK